MLKVPHHHWLLELTSLPTASGREGRVVEWIERWVAARKQCNLTRDRYGNLVIKRRKHSTKNPPIYFTAHLDHPAFVVREILNERELIADFRGGVDQEYFVGTKVALHSMAPYSPPSQGGARGGLRQTSHSSHKKAADPTLPQLLPKREGSSEQPQRGTITTLTPPLPGKTLDKSATIRFGKAHGAKVNDVLTWSLTPTRIKKDRVTAPACDDLAGVAAALAAFDAVITSKNDVDLRLLFTLCEEVGFVGAIGACKARTMEKNALVIALENSRSFAESPIGGGPIVRVGDRTSTFDPDLTYRIGKVAEALAREDKTFRWQRKLMPGGTCEASAYQTYGHIATCLCLPLGNYHNMNEATKKIDHETISLADYDNLVKLLAAVGQQLHDPKLAPPLKPRLDALFKSRETLLEKR